MNNISTLLIPLALFVFFWFPNNDRTKATEVVPKVKAAAQQPQGLWIYVLSWEEGMSSWRRSFAEVLLVAKRMNGTLVLPCVKEGHLCTCEGIPPNERISIGDIYDIQKLQEYRRHMATHEQFRAQTDVAHQSTICMHMGNPRDVCATNRSSLKTDIPELNQAAAVAVNKSRRGISILKVHNFRKQAFFKVRYNGKTLFSNPHSQIDRIVKQLEFRQEHYHRVDDFLARMNITTPNQKTSYAAIQWRAEHPGMDYQKCAIAITRSRAIMSESGGVSMGDFVLISPLNLRPEMQWAIMTYKMELNPGEANAKSSALKLLLDSGFHKLDTVLMTEQGETIHGDQTLLAVWDLILVQRADSFASCYGCQNTSICTHCNWMGNSARYALDLRSRVNKTSFTCWPE
jgi:hypothetical protein